MKEMRSLKSQQQTELIPESFCQAIDILLTKPHVVNKRLWGCKLWKRFLITSKSKKWYLPNEIAKLDCVINDENLRNCTDKVLKEMNLEKCEENDGSIEVVFLELLPRSVSETQVIQLILIDRNKPDVYFYNISQESNCKLCPDFPFSIQVIENQIILNAYCEVDNKSYEWLTNTLLPQIVKWSVETTNITGYKNKCICNESLSLVQQDNYYKKYNELKNKYGKEMVKIWPECTDPTKFVYEDIAIATYLLLLWEEYGLTQKQTFVDLGCGNGLLVYILTKEGHMGIGYDVRKRNIWDMFKDVQLEEKTIVPSDTSLFPKTDWIIGNHSDELTPWIPVIAAKSSFHCNFFLLPCCAYNFDGTKYQRKNSNLSQYMDYLEHIKALCQQCGFNVGVDRLKIPSTKRICLVSRGRTYKIDKFNGYCNIINNFISKDKESLENPSWVKDFKPRDPVERVRNCTQIDKNLINDIVKCIVNYLLDSIDINSSWSAGKTVDIIELIPLISKEQLKQLKAECGGLQTLLKNNHNIFEVHSGKVKIRYPKNIEEVNKRNTKTDRLKVKQKPCWFFHQHPQGCPLSDEQCSFKHKT